jgi:PBP1b-binding outer membrane lipoprotein LpoB
MIAAMLLAGCSQPPVEFTPADMAPTQDMSVEADMPAPVDMPTPVDMPDMAKDMAKVPCDGACE